MKFFDKSDGVSREEYLKNHETHCFGYGYNRTKYANNVKVYNLGLTSEQLDKAFKVINHDAFYDDCGLIIHDSGMKNVFFGRRSGGWLYLNKDIEDVDYDELVEFDRLCDEIRDRLIWYCDNARFEKRTEMIPREYEVMILPDDEEDDYDVCT